MKSISGLSFRYMKQNMQRTLMTILGVALSAMLIYSIFSCSISVFNNQRKTAYVTNMGWDALFVTDAKTACEMLSDIDYYKEHPQSVNNVTGEARDQSPKLSAGWIMCCDDNSYVFYVNDFRALPVQMALLKGTYPNGNKGVIISDSESKYSKYSVGDEYVVSSFVDSEESDEATDKEKVDKHRKDQSFTVCGIYSDKYYMNYWDQTFPGESTYYQEGSPLSLMSADMYEMDKVTVYVTFADKHDLVNQTQKLAQIYGVNEDNYMVTDVAIESFHRENKKETTEYDMFVVVVLALGGAMSLAVIFIVRNSFNISVHERSNDYGILRCIGLTRKQIIWIIMGEAFTVGLIGTVCGMIMGHFMCGVAFDIIGENFDYLGGYHISAQAICWTLFCMIIVTLYSLISPIEKLYKLNPIEALRRVDEINTIEKTLSKKRRKKSPKAVEREKRKQEKLEIKREKKADKLTKKFGVEAGYAYKNMMRTKGALVRTIVTLTIGGGLFIGGSIAMKGMEGWMFYDVNLGGYTGCFSCDSVDEYRTIRKDLSGLDCVEAGGVTSMDMCAWNRKADSVFEDRITFIGLERKDFDALLELGEKKDESGTKNTINVVAVDTKLGADKKHDKLGVSKAAPDINVLSSVMLNDFVEFVTPINMSLTYYTYDNDELYVYCLDSEFETYLTEIVEDALYFRDLSYNIEVNKKAHDYYKFNNYVQNTMHYYNDYSAEMDLVMGAMNITKFVIEFVIGFVLVIFFINSLNQQTAQMMLRKCEFEILSVIGMSKKQRKKMLLIETMTGVVIALILALLCGYIFGNLANREFYLLNYFDEENLVLPHFTMDWLSMLITTVLLLGMGFISSKIVCNETE